MTFDRYWPVLPDYLDYATVEGLKGLDLSGEASLEEIERLVTPANTEFKDYIANNKRRNSNVKTKAL